MKLRICEEYPENRLFCLDLLRGLDMMLLCCIQPLIMAFAKASGCLPEWFTAQFVHNWEGFTVYDIIMPLFIFMCGAAVPFALGRRLSGGRFTAAYWKHVGARFALLWALGMVAQGRLLTYDVSKIMYFSNTLQTIAIGYVAAALVLPVKSRSLRLLPAVLSFFIYAALLHFGGDYTKTGNLAMIVDKRIFGLFLPPTNPMMKQGMYAWVLPSFMYVSMTIFGMESAKLLADKSLGAVKRAVILAVGGAVMLGAGKALSFVMPVIKPIFTPSFTLQAIGWSMLLLAILFALTDVLRFRRGMSVPILFGQHALFAYMTMMVFGGPCIRFVETFTLGLKNWMSIEWVYVFTRIGVIVLMTYLLALRRAFAKKA